MDRRAVFGRQYFAFLTYFEGNELKNKNKINYHTRLDFVTAVHHPMDGSQNCSHN